MKRTRRGKKMYNNNNSLLRKMWVIMETCYSIWEKRTLYVPFPTFCLCQAKNGKKNDARFTEAEKRK